MNEENPTKRDSKVPVRQPAETCGQGPTKGYFRKPKNWVALATLFCVGCYTYITFRLFFVGARAFVYFDRAIIEVVDKPVPPESNGALTAYNLPSVTHRVVSMNFALTNAGNTPTKNARVVLHCAPVSANELQKDDPFSKLKWDEAVARSEIIGPKQTITVGPCEFEATSEIFLNARMGIVPFVLLGEIRYEDRVTFWPWSPQHVTHFSQQLLVDAYDEKFGNIRASTTSIGKHNCTDEDCP